VVERLASVVKELVKTPSTAGASRIDYLHDGGGRAGSASPTMAAA